MSAGDCYTQFAKKSLFLSKKDFSDVVIDYANTLNINDEKEKRELVWVSNWPMMQLLRDDNRWKRLKNSIYCVL